MIDEIYNQKILEWSNKLITPIHLKEPDSTAEVRGKLCGSTVRIELNITGNIITGYGHDVKACKLGSAATAIMQDQIIGCSVDNLRDLCDRMSRMLTAGADAPNQWPDLDMFSPVKGNRFRANTVLLPFQAVVKAIESNLRVARSP
jgi:NifU-like protein involved in Fe-S cluster formation